MARTGDDAADLLTAGRAVAEADEVDAAAPRERVPLPGAQVDLDQPVRAVARVALELDLGDAVEAASAQELIGVGDGLVGPARLADPAGAEDRRTLHELSTAERADRLAAVATE